jgi:hypothetical protein
MDDPPLWTDQCDSNLILMDVFKNKEAQKTASAIFSLANLFTCCTYFLHTRRPDIIT